MKDLFDKIALGILALLGLWTMATIAESVLSRFATNKGASVPAVMPAASATADPRTEEPAT